MLKKPIITLLTDFGYRDHYVSAMKGVILSIAPEATVIDISHGIPKFDVRAGAYVLKAAYKWFPRGTIHVAVVDPGVGTRRRSIVIKTRNYVIIGPDNGLLSLAALDDGVLETRLIQNPRLTREDVSYTFHGRDVFAPVAANLANGVPIDEVGPPLEDGPIVPAFTKPEVKPGYLDCEVLYVDDFGNIVLNATVNDVRKAGIDYESICRVTLKESRVVEAPFLPSYGYAAEGQTLLLINSEDHLELAINKGSAATAYHLTTGDRVTVSTRGACSGATSGRGRKEF